jgi:hypothetical protein
MLIAIFNKKQTNQLNDNILRKQLKGYISFTNVVIQTLF